MYRATELGTNPKLRVSDVVGQCIASACYACSCERTTIIYGTAWNISYGENTVMLCLFI